MTNDEIDQLIATKVMGWKRMTWEEYNPFEYQGRSELTPYWHDSTTLYPKGISHGVGPVPDFLEEGQCASDFFTPSTNLNQAWEVWLKYKTTHDYSDLKINHFVCGNKSFLRVSLDWKMVDLHYEDNLAKAICLVFL